MRKPLRVLIIEDSPDDTELLLRELRCGGYDPVYERVETASGMKILLEQQEWDVVLSDHSMPLFSGIGALTQLQLSGLDLPFIIVSGTIGEEIAVAAMRAGAHDYLMKDNLARLVPAIERELKEAEERRKRKEAEEALRKSEASLANAQRIAHLGNWQWNMRENKVVGSDEFYRIFGKTRQTFNGTYETLLNFVHPDDRVFVKKSVREALDEKKPYCINFRILLPDGSVRIIHTEAEVIFDSAGKAIQMNGTNQDITEYKQAEEEKAKLREQLYHAQKLESVGKLVGCIAHDFNNILSAIIGYVELLQNKMKKYDSSVDDSSKNYIERILAIAEKAIHLTQNLLIFSRKEINNPRPVHVNTIIKRAESLLSNLICENIKLNTVLTDKNYTIMADSGQIEQILMNLATNARDAMPDGGILTIRTEIVTLDNAFIQNYGYGEIGKYVLVSISDTGMGMDEETQKMIFEPFFTTKKHGKGTGLGLAIVYGIVTQHQGYIQVDSARGKGTTFKIYLPIIESDVEEIIPQDLPAPVKGIETILLAEDNIEIRKIIKMVFRGSGYKVIDAVNGEEAVDKFMKNKDDIRLLVFDVMMPKKNGKEAYDEIKKIMPGIKALFMSGYPKDGVSNKIILEESLPFISKPVSPTGLLKKVREVLDT
ncbi:two-component sensor kinase [Candidatus Jettenia caeni]|uniref:histidine kinase n=2 Tax=Candidatus Jettenia TaxID=360731 RepID=I3IR29_9BACT|nr:two-component sensor kinase [Candidatus Jettenia caeni]